MMVNPCLRSWRMALLVLCGLALPPLGATSRAAPGAPEMSQEPKAVASIRISLDLPSDVGTWTRPDTAQTFDERTIFNYMNGGAELYVGYRFSSLDVYEYAAQDPDQDDIVVELYWMDSPDDAFGLLSGDWGGEPVGVSDGPLAGAGGVDPATHRALYSGGLLRLWSDDLYARIMAYRETDASKETVLEIGRAIARGRPNPDPPALVHSLPAKVGPVHELRKSRVRYLRSHFVLNTIYPLGMKNVLDLDPSAEAVMAAYGDSSEGGGEPVWLLLVRYRSATAAQNALDHFSRGYLAAQDRVVLQESSERKYAVEEDGLIGCEGSGGNLVLVFGAPDLTSGDLFVDAGLKALGGGSSGAE